MKKIFLILVILTVNCFAQKSEKDIIKETVIKMWDAIERENVEDYAKFIHPDYTWFGETATELKSGKADEIKSVTDWLKSADNIKTKMINPEIKIYGKTAWITYIWNDEGIEANKKFNSKGKATRIFVKENGLWLCIHSHFTYL